MGQLHFIANWGKCYYKLGQLFFLQIGASVITNWGSLVITNQGKFYYKLGQPLLQIGAAITNWGKLYNKLGQLLQIGGIITNWGIAGFVQSIMLLHAPFTGLIYFEQKKINLLTKSDGNFSLNKIFDFTIKRVCYKQRNWFSVKSFITENFYL